MDINIKYDPNLKQQKFHACGAEEVVYGGAKGGGKSCALVMEALAYGLEYPGAEIYLFRETYDDLEANLIKEWKNKVPKELQKHSFNNSNHYATLINETVIKFRYIRNLQDAESYQGRSMDFIGVDELTKFDRTWIQILMSCLRSAKGFPVKFRGTCNPGGRGHLWVKEDYVNATNYGRDIVVCNVTGNKKVFVPATVRDNTILMKNDPNYVKRLENLPEKERKAFLEGDWDIFEGQYFGEFTQDTHVIEPFQIPMHWKKYVSLDYGLDMFAVLWYAIDTKENVYVYKELHESNLIISAAARRLLEVNNKEKYECIYAPPDLWNRRQDSGKSATDIFADSGVGFVKSKNDRVLGWYAVKEWLNVIDSKDEHTGKKIKVSKLKITSNCINLIRNIPQAQHDEKNPNDVSNEPHEITHILDALRYFCMMRQLPTKPLQQNIDRQHSFTEEEKKTVQQTLSARIDNTFLNY